MAKRDPNSTRKVRRDYRTNPLTEYEIETVKKLHSEGNGKRLISKKSNININVVDKIYEIENLAKQPTIKTNISQDKLEEIKKLHSEGKNQSDIIRITNLSKGVVQRICKEEKLIFFQPKQKELTEEQKLIVLELRKKGLGLEPIGKLLGYGYKVIKRFLQEIGISTKSPNLPKIDPPRKLCTSCNEVKSIDCFKKNWRTLQSGERRFSRHSKCNTCLSLRRAISKAIRYHLSMFGFSKEGSCMKHLPYSIVDLKQHIEKQFESWMSWDNQGTYNIETWDDNDQTTWTWQIDHIIPHCSFNYTNMDSQEFLNCWALSNLRPYSAKQNLLDGDRGMSTQKGKKRNLISNKR